MIKVTCPQCSEPSAVDSSLLGQSVTCSLCEKEFVAQSPEIPSPEIEGKRRKKKKDMPLNDVTKNALLGFSVIAFLVGGGWFWMSEHKKATEEAEDQLIYNRIVAEQEGKRKKHQARFEEEEKEEEAKAAPATLAEARLLYNEFVEVVIGNSGTFQGKKYVNWLGRVILLQRQPYTSTILSQKGIAVEQLYSMADYYRSHKGLSGVEYLTLVELWNAAFPSKTGEELSHAESAERTSARAMGIEIAPKNGEIGSWTVDLPAIDSVTISGDSGGYKLTFRYLNLDGVLVRPATEHLFKRGRKFVYHDDYEWLILRPSGEIELWDEEGLVSKGKPFR